MASRQVTVRTPDLFDIDRRVGKHRIQRLAELSNTVLSGIAESHNVGRGRRALQLQDIWLVSRRQDVPESAQAALLVDELTLLTEDEPLDLRSSDTRWIRPKPDAPTNETLHEIARDTVASWSNHSILSNHSLDEGLRPPQLGSLHALLAHWSIESDSSTVILPTGTGKTDTMIAAMLTAKASPLFVIVPTRALRTQIARKFQALGVLAELNLTAGCSRPIVGILDGAIRDHTELEAVLACNVLVSTMPSAIESSRDLVDLLAEKVDRLFIDEAHHVPAATWSIFRERFPHGKVSHFTATPYRGDGRLIPGRRIYRYPLRRAQAEGYFTPISLAPILEYDPSTADVAIRDAAIDHLQRDLDAGQDHLLMARAASVHRAEQLFDLYRQDTRFEVRLLHSSLPKAERERSLSDIQDRIARIVVCVDMLGEGFDLPSLKIAALHDAHQSLGVTLQFIGRFTRSANGIGTATAVANVADPKVVGSLQQLYHQDSDWNTLIQQLADSRIEREQQRADFIDGFDRGDETLSLQSIRPKLSMAVYRVHGARWDPAAAFEKIPETTRFFVSANPEQHTAAIVTRRAERVSWGDTVEVEDVTHDLLLLHLDTDRNLLYVHSSDTRRYHSVIASAATGIDAIPLEGMEVFKALSGITRLFVANLGLKSAFGRAVAFTMYAGGNVDEGLTASNFRNRMTSNLFGFGFENGERASLGCSHKGRIWSYRVGQDISEWVAWARDVGTKLVDPSIDPESFLRTRMRVEVVAELPVSLRPIAVEWSANVWIRSEDAIQIRFGNSAAIYPLFEVGIDIADPGAPRDLRMRVHSDSQEAVYELNISGTDPQYRHVSGPMVSIRLGRSTWTHISEWFNDEPPTIFFGNGQQLVGKQLLSEPTGEPGYRYAEVEEWDWSGVNPKHESQKREKRPDSIQFRLIQVLQLDPSWDIIFDDDNSGEAADVVAISVQENLLRVSLFHCKFAHGNISASRVDDLYDVCGQAQKSVHWKGDRERLLEHLVKRESQRQRRGGPSRFERGSLEVLQTLRRQVRDTLAEFEIAIVQPGLSRSNISSEQTELLAATELYLNETFNVRLRVIGGP